MAVLHEKMFVDRIRGLSAPGHYIQGPGVLDQLIDFTEFLGDRIVFVLDTFFYKEYTEKLTKMYEGSGNEVTFTEFEGENTESEIARVAKIVTDFKANVIVGIGGGKTLDCSRCVGLPMGIGLITCPTAASTDAPTSSSAIVYKENGEGYLRNALFDKNPHIVLVDSAVIAKAPVRFLASGMGDALATWLECRANEAAATANYVYVTKLGGTRRTQASMAVAKASYELLMAKGRMAMSAARAGLVTPALEDIIEVNTLMSGMGFENTGCAFAHSISHAIYGKVETKVEPMHGEKVAYGCVIQLIMENKPVEEIDELIEFCLDVGLPITLKDLTIDPTDDNIAKIAEASKEPGLWDSEPFYITLDMVIDAIKMADIMVEEHKARRCK